MKESFTTPIAGHDDHDRRVRGLCDLGRLSPGDLIVVTTGQSVWYFTQTRGAHIGADFVNGIMVMTDSRSFGQYLGSPGAMRISRIVRVGEQICRQTDNGDIRFMTGAVNSISVNGQSV